MKSEARLARLEERVTERLALRERAGGLTECETLRRLLWLGQSVFLEGEPYPEDGKEALLVAFVKGLAEWWREQGPVRFSERAQRKLVVMAEWVLEREIDAAT